MASQARSRSRSPLATKSSTRKLAGSFRFAIFDLDGTLIDFEGPSHIGLAKGLQGTGLDPSVLTWELHASIIGMPPQLWAQKLLEALDVSPEAFTAEQYVKDYNNVLAGLYSDILPTKGAMDLIRRYKALGVKMAIATSSQGHCFDAKMKYHQEILNAMDAVVVGDDPAVKRGKPAPDIFLEAARRLGVSPEECVVFEDSPHGIRAGHDAGMFTVAIPDARLPGNDFSIANRVLTSLEDWLAELPAQS